MNIGQAVVAMENGSKVARRGWNLGPQKYTPTTRTPTIYDGLVYILLSNGSVAICDESDYDLVKNHHWTFGAGGYPCITNNSITPRRTIKIHQILNPAWGMTDHINGDRLDNRRENLRECNSRQNNANTPSRRGGTSRYKGVSFDKSREKWISSIQINNKTQHLGRYDCEEDAAKAYDRAAKASYGDFARLNFPEPSVFLFLVPGSTFKVNRPPLLGIYEEGTEINYHAHVDMRTADGKIVPWACSQSDLLSKDWYVVE